MIEAFCVDLNERRFAGLVDQLIHCCDGHPLTTFPRWGSLSSKTAPVRIPARQLVAFLEAMEHRLAGLVADGHREHRCGRETLSELGCELRLRLDRYDPRPSADHARGVRAAVCPD